MPGQLLDHGERFRRLHVAAVPTRGDLSARYLADHLARTGHQIIELLSPGYRAVVLDRALREAAGPPPG